MIKSICVIDDDEIYQMIIKRLITKAKAFDETSYFMSATEALQNFDENISNLPSAILLDINMPIMDGWQFLKKLENTFPSLYDHTKVYIVTSSIAYSDKDKIEEFPKVSDFLSKPLSVEKLEEIGNSMA
ncbi:response regulator [Christiangramia sp. SM2212]|uniref:Response regulator n=1 Tax=Christiangramia sediminicola TaxID=3073267 RepID=A0ABU1ELT5_9FLAO|nr:response regulator [Christiangramia sp. SM2212]MDR5589351.1 response regulator [Christiangramia sp. SM2212]